MNTMINFGGLAALKAPKLKATERQPAHAELLSPGLSQPGSQAEMVTGPLGNATNALPQPVHHQGSKHADEVQAAGSKHQDGTQGPPKQDAKSKAVKAKAGGAGAASHSQTESRTGGVHADEGHGHDDQQAYAAAPAAKTGAGPGAKPVQAAHKATGAGNKQRSHSARSSIEGAPALAPRASASTRGSLGGSTGAGGSALVVPPEGFKSGEEVFEFNRALAAQVEALAGGAEGEERRPKRRKSPPLQQKLHEQWGGKVSSAQGEGQRRLQHAPHAPVAACRRLACR